MGRSLCSFRSTARSWPTEALQSAELLTEVFGSRLTLLHVIQPPAYPLYGEGYAYVPFDEDARARRRTTIP